MITTKLEYAQGFSTIREALQQHTAFCLCNNFDQIRGTNLLAVQCIACGALMHVQYDRLAYDLFCDNCKHTQLTADMLPKVQARLSAIQQKLLMIQ